uniref:hypothetical protein n=1 Tax=Pseudoalteromonas mariniglutinosa TaxID=206042 RepID=UPI00387F68B1
MKALFKVFCQIAGGNQGAIDFQIDSAASNSSLKLGSCQHPCFHFLALRNFVYKKRPVFTLRASKAVQKYSRYFCWSLVTHSAPSITLNPSNK